MKYVRLVAFLVYTISINSIAHAAEIRTVALSGQHAPGTASGVNYGGFSPLELSPVLLNDAGQTAFLAVLTGSDVNATNDRGFWSEGSGSLELVARTGSQAPGAPSGVNFSTFASNTNPRMLNPPVLNDAGRTAFRAQLTDFSEGVWSEGLGSLALVARTGEHAHGAPIGVNYGKFDPGLSTTSVLNNAGQTAYWAGLTGSGVDFANGQGIWSEGSGGLALVARDGEHAQGAPSGVNYFGINVSVLNNAGQTAFVAFLRGSGVDATNNKGIWSEGSGSVALVARSGQPAPGTPSGVTFSDFNYSSLALNDSGQTAFYASLAGSGVNSTNNSSVWSEGSGSLTLVARKGDQAPGAPSGVNYGGFLSPLLNNAGQTAFNATLAGSGVSISNNEGLWSEGPGNLTLVAREGDHAPGTPIGVNYFGSFKSLVLNDAGQTAFYSFLTGSGVDSSNNSGIWATDRTGALKLIAREGDLLEVAPGDLRTISLLFAFDGGGTGNSDGRPSGFNNLGQLAFWASFTDGTSGIFVSNRVAVPEPSTLLLLCFGSLAVLWRRRGLVCAAILAGAVGFSCADRAAAVTIDMVTVGNPGNAPDLRYNLYLRPEGFGIVDHVFQIGKYEVTAGQYTEFLNAVADADPNGLYNTAMDNPNLLSRTNIQRTGSSPNYSYGVAADWANRPVNWVSVWDAARFANWLHNGQPTGAQGPGTTEGGAYHDVGNETLFGRNAGAKFFIPTDDEWYKAAYHDKTAGLAASYFDYPTGTNAVPGNNIDEATNPGNNANYIIGPNYAIGTPYFRTIVGEFELSDSPYGTFDQGGNVFEWNETLLADAGSFVRGGGLGAGSGNLIASWYGISPPSAESGGFGFRVASPAIPEPTTLLLVALAGLGLLWRRRSLS